MKIINSRKGAGGETAIMSSILIIFIILAVTLPLILLDFNETSSASDYASLNAEVSNAKTINSPSVWNLTGIPVIDVIFSIIAMATWTFGGINVWVDLLLLMPLRIILWIGIYKLFRSGT